MVRRLIALAIIPLVLLVVAKTAENVTTYTWNQVVEYQSPYLASLPYGQPADRLSDQVVLFVADGLRADTSRTMPSLNRLRQQGADLVAVTGEPSLSLPSWTVIASGAYQEVTGVTTNWYEGAVKVDNLFAEARRRGLTTGVAGSSSWQQLFGAWLDQAASSEEPHAYGDVLAIQQFDAEVMKRASEMLRDKKPNFMVIHLSGPDYVGHSFGAASEQYRQEALVIDEHLATLLQNIDLGQTTVIFTADHGQIDRGGHGGGEPEVKHTPLVIAGKGIKGSGSVADVGQTDIAPTVAALLGIPVPIHNQGRVLLEALAAPAALKGQYGLVAAQQLAVFYDSYAVKLGAKSFAQAGLATAQAEIASGDPAALARFRSQLDQGIQSPRLDKLNRERLIRLLPALLVVIVPVFYLGRSKVRQHLAVPVLGAAVYFALYNLLFFGQGNRWSLSVFNREELLLSFFKQRGLEALLAVVIAVVVVGLLSRRQTAWQTAWGVVNMSVLIAYLLVIQIVVFFVLYGFSYSWFLPDLQIGFKAYLDLLQLVSTAWPMPYLPVVVLLPFIGVAVRSLAAWVLARRQARLEATMPLR